MEIFSDVISKARPNLSQSSIKTYSSILKNLYKKLYPEDKDIDIKKLDNDKVVLDYFKNIDGSKRKTEASARRTTVPGCKTSPTFKSCNSPSGVRIL